MHKKAILGAIFALGLAFGGLNSYVAAVGESTINSETILEEGTSGEPEVVCADKSEPGCEDSDSTPEIVEADGETTEIKSKTWPLIVLLVALGVAVALVIIIKLFGRKKK